MNQFGIPQGIWMLCILKTCYALDGPYIEGGITGHILEFNCSTGKQPLGQTVEIVANGISQFSMAHFNTSCIRKHVECKPNECACTSNWFQWKMAVQNPTITLQVQCLMRFPDNKREKVKATIAFNGSYFWDYSAYQTITTKAINFETTTKAVADTNNDSSNVHIYVVILSAFLLVGVIIFIGIWSKCATQQNTESTQTRDPDITLQRSTTMRENRRQDTDHFNTTSTEMFLRERITEHEF